LTRAPDHTIAFTGDRTLSDTLLSTLSSTIANACHLAQTVTDAKSVTLLVPPWSDNWKSLAFESGMFELAANFPAIDGEVIDRANAHIVQTTALGSFTTDLIDLHVDIKCEHGHPIGRLVLNSAPGQWQTKARLRVLDMVAELLSDQLRAMRDLPKRMAGTMLELIEKLADLDAAATPPTLAVFLRMIAGKAPSRSQMIALQITGLVESHSSMQAPDTLSVTETAHDILRAAGFIGWSDMRSGCLVPESALRSDADTPSPREINITPFAVLRVMERAFQIAEDPDTESLLFRTPEQQEWSFLNHTTDDGWTAVAAEIIRADPEAQLEFIRMHLLRRRDLPTEEVAETFEILGHIFWLRLSETGVEIRVQGQDWRPINVSAELESRTRAVAAVQLLQAEHVISLDAATHDWSIRMAHGVQIMPAPSSAAA